MKQNPRTNSLFITLEGGEGAGKTTLANKLAAWLRERGCEVVLTREPGGSPLGEAIRGLLLNHEHNFEIGSRAELLLFLAARAQHLEQLIMPALADGKIVICDRFNDSTVAYQGLARGLGVEYVEQLCHLICEGTVAPDVTFLLDVDPYIGLERTTRLPSGEQDRIESESMTFHQKVREALLALANKNSRRTRILNAQLAENEVLSNAQEFLESYLERMHA